MDLKETAIALLASITGVDLTVESVENHVVTAVLAKDSRVEGVSNDVG